MVHPRLVTVPYMKHPNPSYRGLGPHPIKTSSLLGLVMSLGSSMRTRYVMALASGAVEAA